tara:strand:+ start:26 stop:667 length:642 start_codon:yes stop_codon:yes gene_type:complete
MSTSKFSDPFMMKSPVTPIQGNAFIKAKIDAEEAGKTSFSFNGKNYPLKMEAESPVNSNHLDSKIKIEDGETTKIKKDKKGEYSIIDAPYGIKGINQGDTIRPASGKIFNPNKRYSKGSGSYNYLTGGLDFVRTDENNIKLTGSPAEMHESDEYRETYNKWLSYGDKGGEKRDKEYRKLEKMAAHVNPTGEKLPRPKKQKSVLEKDKSILENK